MNLYNAVERFPGWKNFVHDFDVARIGMNESFYRYNHNSNDDDYDNENYVDDVDNDDDDDDAVAVAGNKHSTQMN